MITDDYCNIGKLLLLTIIASSKNWTILIIVTEEKIAHPYFQIVLFTSNVVTEIAFLNYPKS